MCAELATRRRDGLVSLAALATVGALLDCSEPPPPTTREPVATATASLSGGTTVVDLGSPVVMGETGTAFDGANYWVAWTAAHSILGVRVDPAGSKLGPAETWAGAGADEPHDLRVGHDGTGLVSAYITGGPNEAQVKVWRYTPSRGATPIMTLHPDPQTFGVSLAAAEGMSVVVVNRESESHYAVFRGDEQIYSGGLPALSVLIGIPFAVSYLGGTFVLFWVDASGEGHVSRMGPNHAWLQASAFPLGENAAFSEPVMTRDPDGVGILTTNGRYPTLLHLDATFSAPRVRSDVGNGTDDYWLAMPIRDTATLLTVSAPRATPGPILGRTFRTADLRETGTPWAIAPSGNTCCHSGVSGKAGQALVAYGRLQNNSYQLEAARVVTPGVFGDACSTDDACASGICSEGRCCDCRTACQTCRGATPGRCEPVRRAEHAGFCGGGDVCDDQAQCRRKQGSVCANDAECVTGHCVDGVCCAGTCDEPCATCAPSSGVCVPRAAGSAPKGGACGGVACSGRDVLCNAQVRPLLCTSDHEAEQLEGGAKDCSPYKCRDGACMGACESVYDCVSGSVCTPTGQCVPSPPGASSSATCSASVPRKHGPIEALAGLVVMTALARRRQRRPSEAAQVARRTRSTPPTS